MPRFNVTGSRAPQSRGPITVQPGTEHTNLQGGVGYTRDDKSDLYLLATTSHDLTAAAFYETGAPVVIASAHEAEMHRRFARQLGPVPATSGDVDARVLRFRHLIQSVAPLDPDWTYQFLTWLRTKGNIRTAALVGGVEAARALVAAGIPGGRHMISTVLRRPDEPGEAIAYHHAVHGRKLSMAFKRGVGDAAVRLYNERALLKYDTASHGLRFGDVLAITHPSPAGDKARWQHELFAYAIDRRYGRDSLEEVSPTLRIVRANRELRALIGSGELLWDRLDADFLSDAGMTWEDVLSLAGGAVDKASLWRNLIPSMGFMARIRNLRNFDQAGLTDADVRPVLDMLADPGQVRASKQLPLRFLSAYRAAPSLRWGHALDQALNVSVGNIPPLLGRTLILIDTSTSMRDPLSERSDLLRWDAAVAFGLALARRCEQANVVSYAGSWRGSTADRVFPAVPGESLLTSITRWSRDGYFLGGGTDTVGALRKHYRDHDRVVLLTDEQDGGFHRHPYHGTEQVGDQIPANKYLHTFNLAGYKSSHAATNRYRVVLGGLTDVMFPLIAQIEAGGRPGAWPWTGDPDISSLPSYTRAPAVHTGRATGGAL